MADLLLPVQSHHCCTTHSACDCVLKRLIRLEAMLTAARSVTCEEQVEGLLLCYSQGVALLQAIRAIEEPSQVAPGTSDEDAD